MFITVCSFGVSLLYVSALCSLVISKLISYPTTIRSIHLYNSTTQTCESYWRAHSCPDVCITSSPGDRCTPTCRRPLTCLPPTPTLRGHEARFLSRRRRRRGASTLTSFYPGGGGASCPAPSHLSPSVLLLLPVLRALGSPATLVPGRTHDAKARLLFLPELSGTATWQLAGFPVPPCPWIGRQRTVCFCAR